MYLARSIFVFVILFSVTFELCAIEDNAIGQEYIKPLKYPKFSATGNYGIFRRFVGLQDSDLAGAYDNQFEVEVSKEIGLYKYMNAGFRFNSNIPFKLANESEPLAIRFSLFAKPFIPLAGMASVFVKFGGGISGVISGPAVHLRITKSGAFAPMLKKTIGNSRYETFGFGFNAFVRAGVDFFPFKRFGIALETGLDAELVLHKKSVIYFRPEDAELRKNDFGPAYLAVLNYWMPLSITLHLIL